jgi:hypothetical protein
MEEFVSDWMNFPDALRRGVLLKPVDIIQFLLRADKNNWQFLCIYIYIYISVCALLARAYWGCHGSKTMAIKFIDFTAAHCLNKMTPQSHSLNCTVG